MSDHKPEYTEDEEIVVLTDEDGVQHRVVPVLTAQGGDAYYFYFYEEDDSDPESPTLFIMKLFGTAEDGTEELVPLDDAEWDEAVAIYDEAIADS